VKTYVLYHDNCPDGFGAAYAARLALGDGAIYVPVSYGQPLPEIENESVVYIVDFSYPRDVLLELKARSRNLIVLDHHKTAQADLEGLDFCTFDMERSGAGITWDYFHASPRPALIDYVEDRDLWRFRLPHSKEISAYIASYPKQFVTWHQIDHELRTRFVGVAAQGNAILRFQGQKVREMADNVRVKDIGGYEVPYTNTTVFFSEVGEELCKLYPDAPFAAYYLDRKDGRRQWGLRSRNGFDVSAVAKLYGGGGHAAAAGFVEAL